MFDTITNLPSEIWKEIKDFPFYSVSNKGRVKRDRHEKFYVNQGACKGSGHYQYFEEQLIKPSKKKTGYLQVTLYHFGRSKTFLVHRLVAEAFIENPENLPEVNHLNENKEDNRVENLKWASSVENSNYGTRNQRISQTQKGTKRKKLTKKHKAKIAKSLKGKNCKKVQSKYKEFDSVKAAAKYYKVNPTTMSGYLNGRIKMPDKIKKHNLRFIGESK